MPDQARSGGGRKDELSEARVSGPGDMNQGGHTGGGTDASVEDNVRGVDRQPQLDTDDDEPDSDALGG